MSIYVHQMTLWMGWIFIVVTMFKNMLNRSHKSVQAGWNELLNDECPGLAFVCYLRNWQTVKVTLLGRLILTATVFSSASFTEWFSQAGRDFQKRYNWPRCFFYTKTSIDVFVKVIFGLWQVLKDADPSFPFFTKHILFYCDLKHLT